MKKRFNVCHGIIIDNLTGDHYYLSEVSSIVRLLNKVNTRADNNAEKFLVLKEEYNKVMSVLRKYNIDSADKLDIVLWSERVW